jgi:SpoVK/Ycf46/Vps4 family AAA+-type ATPase
MTPASSALNARLKELQKETGLTGAELQIVRPLAEAFRAALDRFADLPPSRRQWAVFWEGKEDWFAEGASRTGRELLGLAAGPKEETLLDPAGRLLAGEAESSVRPLVPLPVVRLLRAGDEVATRRYVLTVETARFLFTGAPDVDPEFLALGLNHLAGAASGAGESSASGEPRPKRLAAPRRSLEPADDPEATPEEALFDVRAPEIGFEQVILPAETLREIRTALVQIRKHPLLVERWGVGERYRMGRGLAFNFAGPPGTGKTLTAEAVAKELGRPLMTVKYSGLESKWIGETGKHLAAVFAAARRQEAVLFFDEADAIASRRTANMEGSGRHYNQTVNILLHELELYEGVVIFATNLAANFDPAFERRIQSHVLFRMPDTEERERIWRAHLPPRAPLAPDVDLRRLAEAFEMAGGDIRNAMLKAVHLAALVDAPDEALQITQEHLLAGARSVLHARAVMAQSIFDRAGSRNP